MQASETNSFFAPYKTLKFTPPILISNLPLSYSKTFPNLKTPFSFSLKHFLQ